MSNPNQPISLVRRVTNFGFRRYCPACGGRTRAFLPYGVQARPDACCPLCRSTERERAQVLLLQKKILPALAEHEKLRILHVAPEVGVARVLCSLGGDYLSGDLEPGKAMATVDLTRLTFAPESFDFVFLSHVLEHIPDDRAAIAEVHRVLSPGGLAFIEVPVLARTTYEDWSLTTDEQRTREFGQRDHVRLCGLDYVDRLRERFAVETLVVEEQFSADDIERMRLCAAELPEAKLPRAEKLFHVSWLCRKAANYTD